MQTTIEGYYSYKVISSPAYRLPDIVSTQRKFSQQRNWYGNRIDLMSANFSFQYMLVFNNVERSFNIVYTEILNPIINILYSGIDIILNNALKLFLTKKMKIKSQLQL